MASQDIASDSTSESLKATNDVPVVGRPRLIPAPALDSLCVRIDSSNPDGKQLSHFSSSLQTPQFTLNIPNRLLLHWYNAATDTTYVQHLNSAILGGVVCIRQDCDRVEERLRAQATKLAKKITQTTGRKREYVLNSNYHLYVLDGDAISVIAMMEERDIAELNAEAWRQECMKRDDEITQLLQEMAMSIAQYEEDGEELALQRKGKENRGKIIEDVAPRQARRKVNDFTAKAKDAMWFATSFGLIPESITLRKQKSGSPLKISLQQSQPSPSPSMPPTDDDKQKVLQVLYLLDRFAVSDEAYHELRMQSNSLPPLYKVKSTRSALNESLNIQRLPAPYYGAYRPLRDSLLNEIAKVPETASTPIKVKISGDGARFTRSSNLILLSFSLPGTCEHVLSGSDMLKVLKSLPPKFIDLLQDPPLTILQKIWTDFYELYKDISSWNPPQYDEVHTRATKWVKLFLKLETSCQGFQKKHITPYMHCLVYHVPVMIRKYGNIKQFSGQGVEKNNDDARRNYFSSNLHDPAGEILKAEGRLEITQEYQHTKRQYNKRKDAYWAQGGIQETRKQRRLNEPN